MIWSDLDIFMCADSLNVGNIYNYAQIIIIAWNNDILHTFASNMGDRNALAYKLYTTQLVILLQIAYNQEFA
jgi:hypothetical protein